MYVNKNDKHSWQRSSSDQMVKQKIIYRVSTHKVLQQNFDLLCHLKAVKQNTELGHTYLSKKRI